MIQHMDSDSWEALSVLEYARMKLRDVKVGKSNMTGHEIEITEIVCSQ